jgi:NTE family protein
MSDDNQSAHTAPEAPVTFIPPDRSLRGPQPGIALCLSGGGYRAMLFHVGALWRLNEAGLLPRIQRISSVSGGSITAALLGLKWAQLDFDASGVARAFADSVVNPLRSQALRTIDVPAILFGICIPALITRRVVRSYGRLFKKATLADLPVAPKFVLNATNVMTGDLWRFSRSYMADWRVGKVANPDVPLAVAVAASAAFPPFLSPLSLPLAKYTVETVPGADLHQPPYTQRALLSDGGVYDNLGLETAWKSCTTVLVSDGGMKMAPQERPWSMWLVHLIRVLNVIDNQVRSLRKRLLIDSYTTNDPARKRFGAYWGIETNINNYLLPDALECPLSQTSQLAAIPTRLAALPARTQEQLINWGYAVCDAALRKHYDPAIAKPRGFPYRDAGV